MATPEDSGLPTPLASVPLPGSVPPDDDTLLITLFLQTKSPGTRRVYGLTIRAFQAACGRPLA